MKRMGLKPLALLTLGCCAVIVADGYWLTLASDQAATAFKLSKSFVGTVFLATVSSLPEMVSIWACLRLGLADMAIGAVFGSNIFNICILAFGDLCYRQGSIFATVGTSFSAHITTVGITLGMTVVALLALVMIPRSRAEGQEKAPPARAHKLCSLALALLYCAAMYMSYVNTK